MDKKMYLRKPRKIFQVFLKKNVTKWKEKKQWREL